MRLDKIDLNLFVVFDAIYSEQSITQAAAKLHITQPAVSNALARLREMFSDKLFVRTPMGMMPTPVADAAVADIRQALLLMSNTVQSSRNFQPNTSAKVFRLGINELSETLLLPQLVSHLGKSAPNVRVHSFYLDRENATQDLKAGNIDLLVDAATTSIDGLLQYNLGDSAFVVAMNASHPLANKRVTLEEYLTSEHILVSSRRQGLAVEDRALQKLGKQRQVNIRVQHYDIAAKLVAANQLLWTLPKSYAQSTDLVYQTVPFNIEPLPWNLYWHKSADQDAANIWLRQSIIELLQKES